MEARNPASEARAEQRPGPAWLHSLRTRLVASSIVLVVVPGFLFAALAFSRAESAIEKANGLQLAQVTGEAAEEFAAAIQAERANLRSWAKNEVMREIVIRDVDKRVARYIGAMQKADAAYLAVTCVDREGRAVAVSDPRDFDRYYVGEPWFMETSAGRDAFVGPRRSERYGRSVLEIATPIFDPDSSGKRIGAALLVYDWKSATAPFERTRIHLAELGTQMTLVVVDDRSAVIGGAWGAGYAAPEPAVVARVRALLDPGPGSQRRSSWVDRETDAIVSGAALERVHAGWHVLGIWPLADALRAVHRLERQWALMLLVILVASVAVATVQSDRIVRPLRALTAATRDLGRAHNPRRPVTARSRDEIGELAAAFDAMAGELERAQDELVTATKFRFASEMAAGIAHEVRTPLGVLRTSAQVLGRSVPPGDARSRELVEMIVAEVDRLERVVAGLLELSRPREPATVPVPLAEILARAKKFLGAQAAEREISLRLEPGPASAPALCDPEQIYQVVLNLVVNAIHAAPVGGTVTLREVADPPERVGIEVIDDGPGIPAEVRERIFTPFFTTRQEGTGLGLAVADRIVRGHHGTIEVDNVPGRGARFRVWLSAAEALEEVV
jgi:two-component system, NtrC family, sensor histidine kinase HydH